jgi:hypothetical protein
MSRKVEYGMCCWCVQGTNISSLESVDMLFKFIKPLVEEGEDDDDMDEEVRHTRRWWCHPAACSAAHRQIPHR